MPPSRAAGVPEAPAKVCVPYAASLPHMANLPHGSPVPPLGRAGRQPTRSSAPLSMPQSLQLTCTTPPVPLSDVNPTPPSPPHLLNVGISRPSMKEPLDDL